MRANTEMSPIHANAAPVRAYAQWISETKGEPYVVITIPQGSAAYRMGYRFTSIPESEQPHYVANGATVVPAE